MPNFSTGKRINRTTAVCYFAIVVIFAVFKLLAHFEVFSSFSFVGKELLSAFMQVGILFALAFGVMALSTKRKPLEIFRFYGFKKISLAGVLLSILIGVVVYILNVYVSSFFNMFLESVGYNFSKSAEPTSYPVWLLLVNILSTAILPAICEETSHRGMVLNGASARYKRSRAIIISSVLFGLLHCNIEQFFYATLIGFLLGYLASVMENIYPCIIIHFMNNFLSVFMGFSRFHKLGADYLFTYTNQFLQNNALLGLLFVVILVVLLFFLLKLLVHVLFKKTILKQLEGLNNKVLTEISKMDYVQDFDSIIKTGDIYRPTEFQDYARFKALYYVYGKEYGFTSELKQTIGDEPPARDKIATAFYVTSFVILSALTIFSFVWGVI